MDEKLTVGDIVMSSNGHDKNRPFIVVSIDKNGYFAIIDGKFRTRDNPKIKNPKHLIKIGHSDEILEKLASKTVTETEINKLIKAFIKIKE